MTRFMSYFTRLTLCGILALGMLVTFPGMQVYAQVFGGQKKIVVHVEDSNIAILAAPKKEVSVDYDQQLFNVKQEAIGQETTITISATEQYNKQQMPTSKATVYLPEDTTVSIKSKNSGVEVQPINADITVDSQDDAFSFYVPEGFTGSVNGTVKNGACKAIVSDKATNYELNVKMVGSAVSLPYKWGTCTESSYTRTEGNGKAKINLDVDTCAVSFKLEEDQSAA